MVFLANSHLKFNIVKASPWNFLGHAQISAKFSHQAQPVIPRKVYNFLLFRLNFKIFHASVKVQSKKRNFWNINRSTCSRLPNERRMRKWHFRYICYKLHLAWHNLWYYHIISTYWWLCIIATTNFAFGSGRNRAISRLVRYSRRRREKIFNISVSDCRTETLFYGV